jgi:hypothetical protein
MPLRLPLIPLWLPQMSLWLPQMPLCYLAASVAGKKILSLPLMQLRLEAASKAKVT